MTFPGDQVTAPPDRRRPDPAGDYAYARARGSFDDEPADFAPAGSLPPVRDGRPAGTLPAGTLPARTRPTRTRPALPRARQTRRASPGDVPPLSAASVPRPRQGNTPDPRTGRPPQPVDQHRAAHPGSPGHAPAGSGSAPGRSRRDPARGYPPLPGDPGPRYPQVEFSAWNEPGASAPRAHEARGRLPHSAPTWTDARDAATVPSREHGSGLALAERGDDDLATYRDNGPAGISDDSVAAWSASLADVQARALAEPSPPASGTGTIERDPEAAGPLADAEPEPTTEPQPASGAQSPTGSLPNVGSLHEAGPRRDSAVSRTTTSATVTRAAAARARKNARRRGRTRRRVVMAGVSLPAIAILAAMAYTRYPGWHAAASSPSSPRSQGSPAALSDSQPSPSLGRWEHIATRATDPSPLTLSQLFPAQFTVASAAYARTTQLASTHCPGAVFGTKLQAAVRKYKCSQVMRASYLAKGPKLMGTIGVLNLSNSAGAKAVGQVTGSSQFIAQLTAHSGPTHSLAKGTGLEEAEVKGHYLILTWVESTTLRAPRTAHQKAQLKAFSANLINRTANVSLTSRMVTGEPQVP
jgi:hypothetical protein